MAKWFPLPLNIPFVWHSMGKVLTELLCKTVSRQKTTQTQTSYVLCFVLVLFVLFYPYPLFSKFELSKFRFLETLKLWKLWYFDFFVLNFHNFGILEFKKSQMLKVLKRQAPKHHEDPSKNFLKILEMGPISSWKHEMIFWEYLIPII